MTLKESRLGIGLTQEALADMVGLVHVSISLIERGLVKPRAKTRRKLEQVVGRKIDWKATYKHGADVRLDSGEILETQIAQKLYQSIFLPNERRQRIAALLKIHFEHIEETVDSRPG